MRTSLRRITLSVALLLLALLAAWIVGFLNRGGRLGAAPGKAVSVRNGASLPSPSGLRVSFEAQRPNP